MRTRVLTLAVGFLLTLPAAPALGVQHTFAWDFQRDLPNGPGALRFTLSDSTSDPSPIVAAFRATFPGGTTLSGTPTTPDYSCTIDATNKNVMTCTGGSGAGLTPGHSLEVSGFSTSPTLPDGGGSQVQFSVQRPGTGFAPADGTGSGPPDPCPQNAAPPYVKPHSGPSHDPLTRFITQVYRDLLGRTPTKSESSHFHSLLESGAVSREQVVLPILSSPEYRTGLVKQFYEELLRRKPTAGEISAGVSQLGAHSDEQLKAILMGSAEYFAKCAHSDDTSFIQHAYRDLLGRDPTPSQVSFWRSKGGGLRDDTPASLVSSDEYFARVVRQLYRDLLNRDPTAAEWAVRRKQFKAGKSDEQIKANLMGSAEYFFGRTGVTEYFQNPKVNFKKHQVRVKMLRKAVFQLVVEKVTGHTTLKGTQIRIPKLKRIGVVSFGELAKGRYHKGWDGTIKGNRLANGNYLLVPEAVDGGGHLLYITAPAALKVKEKSNK